MTIDKNLKENKTELIAYFRDRATEAFTVIKERFSESQFASRARAINNSLNETKDQFISTVLQTAENENWSNQEKLECLLIITYSYIVVLIESRNSVRNYDNMDFSRRVGELWDPFCQLCFKYPSNDLTLFIPPLFSDAKRKLTNEIIDYINLLNISIEQKNDLKLYYNKVWSLVTSGEIQLRLDMHFIQGLNKYVVDFKSGYGSNEKGNLNRLLLVATVYKYLNENYKCILLVRANVNNSYFKILKNSQIWEAYSGQEAYDKILQYSGYNLRDWIDKNVDWKNDFNKETVTLLKEKNLLQYLIW